MQKLVHKLEKINIEQANNIILDFFNHLRRIDFPYKPSIRQTISTIKLLNLRYHKQGYVTLNDLIKLITLTTPPHAQKMIEYEFLNWFLEGTLKKKNFIFLPFTIPFIPFIKNLLQKFSLKIPNPFNIFKKFPKTVKNRANLKKSPSSYENTMKKGNNQEKEMNNSKKLLHQLSKLYEERKSKMNETNYKICEFRKTKSLEKEINLRDSRAFSGKFKEKIKGKTLRKAKEKENIQNVYEKRDNLDRGYGENLLKKWTKELKPHSKELRELVRELLLTLSDRYLSQFLGSSRLSLSPGYSLRPFEKGDSYDEIDIEESIYNILAKGKKFTEVTYEDFLVRDYDKSKRDIVILLDISGSMIGYKLLYMAITAVILLKMFKNDRVALAFFESNTYEVKRINEPYYDFDKLVDLVLGLYAFGGTCASRALLWAEEQLSLYDAKEKLLIVLSDLAFFDLYESLYVINRLSKRVKMIFIVPFWSYDHEVAKILKKKYKAYIMEVYDWRQVPQKIIEYFIQYFSSS